MEGSAEKSKPMSVRVSFVIVFLANSSVLMLVHPCIFMARESNYIDVTSRCNYSSASYFQRRFKPPFAEDMYQ